jgi:hypothetical protein
VTERPSALRCTISDEVGETDAKTGLRLSHNWYCIANEIGCSDFGESWPRMFEVAYLIAKEFLGSCKRPFTSIRARGCQIWTCSSSLYLMYGLHEQFL